MTAASLGAAPASIPCAERERARIAALFVDRRGVYSFLPGIDVWDESRDARSYAGPYPVVAHPPCAAWGAYARRSESSRARGPLLGEDGGCFRSAFKSLLAWGGVLEHPRGSLALVAECGRASFQRGIWIDPLASPGARPSGVWCTEVDQGRYGHVAAKATWLVVRWPSLACPPALDWRPAEVIPRGSGARRGNLESLSHRQRAATPLPFALLLVDLARGAACDGG